jgi:DNA primase
MAGRIPQSFIDDVVSRVDIVDIIDSRVPLKKAGREYQACCPFHNEKTPSFTVSPGKQFYHCFGCGAHGTAIGFLMEYENLDFIEAVKELASSVGMQMPTTDFESYAPAIPRFEIETSYKLLEQAKRYFQQQLRDHPQGPNAIEYLKKRGLSGEIARDFSIGYVPDGWDNFIKASGAQCKELVAAGLVIEKDNNAGCYDRFRDRVMFPIHDQGGRVIAFGGRVMGDGTPKYLNSPETSVFHKGKELYGLFEARRRLKKINSIIVVEGYMDVVALAQFGVYNVVATLGTAVTEQHINRLFRTCDQVVFCFDGDRAGQDAAWRGMENALPVLTGERQLKFLFLPEGEDPDTLIRKVGTDEFNQLVEKSQTLSEFLLKKLSSDIDMRQIDGQARLLERAKPILEKMADGVIKDRIAELISNRARADKSALVIQKTRATQSRPSLPKHNPRQPPSLLRRVIGSITQMPELAKCIDDPQKFSSLNLPGILLFIEIVEFLQGYPNVTTATILEHFRERAEGKHLMALSQQSWLLEKEDGDIEQEFKDSLNELERLQLQQEHDELLNKFQSEGLTDSEKQRYQTLIRQIKRN